jgi:hypothetical protein
MDGTKLDISDRPYTLPDTRTGLDTYGRTSAQNEAVEARLDDLGGSRGRQRSYHTSTITDIERHGPR